MDLSLLFEGLEVLLQMDQETSGTHLQKNKIKNMVKTRLKYVFFLTVNHKYSFHLYDLMDRHL